ncbi:MAG: transketolase C-terminal domain-containing protein [Desulfopila sp.]|jgi:transketolase C-terminal domain/subunit/transketolase N-terminal domain/subunit|nr:transketolase C-terminal domain-containing protein [Desulfopila sp.]
MKFPIDLSVYKKLVFTTSQKELNTEQREQLLQNIQLVRDSIVFFTALANCKGLGGHTGGAYDIVPEVLVLDGFMNGDDRYHPVFFDEAGHRVALQYIMAVLNGHADISTLLHYREFKKGLYGHPERDDENGIFFSSGRLGHLWSHVNGVAEALKEKVVVMLGSDGSQQEGDDAEAARYAVARNLNVKLLIDDNDVTIAGYPSKYMTGYDIGKTLAGHGLQVSEGDGENIDELFNRIRESLLAEGPVALVNKRKMAIGVPGIEGLPKGHDVIPVDMAISYLESKGHAAAALLLQETIKDGGSVEYLGSSSETAKCRDDFGKIVSEILSQMKSPEEKVIVIDSDLEGSCGLHHIRKNCPQVYVHGGIMERNNFSVAAGFGSTPGRQGIFGTFSAFQEMVVSEITMARLNKANVIAHFSHAGVDDMADNTCHFGVNNFFADNGLGEDDTRLYFPADALQLKAMLGRIFNDSGLRFIYSTRSATPFIEKKDGSRFFAGDYAFVPGKDEIIREGSDGYILSYGEMLYRCLHVVELLHKEGVDVGLINKPTLNVIDEEMLAKAGKSPFLLVVETQNRKTGLGMRYGTWLLENGFTPRYAHMGSHKEGRGGLSEQIPYQGMATEDILARVRSLMK